MVLEKSVYSRLREDILSSAITPEETLTEVKLTQRYGASRTPVREALQRLEQDGLLERRGKVLAVRTHTAEEIVDIYESRIVLEEAAAAKAARKRTDLDIRLLRAKYQSMRALDPADGPALAEANREFHGLIWTAAHSPSLMRLLTGLDQQVRRYTLTTLTHPGRWDAVLADYEALVAATEAGDTTMAGDIAARHMTEALEIRLQMYAEDPQRL